MSGTSTRPWWQGTWDSKTAAIATGFAATTLNYLWTVCTNGFPWFPFAGTVIVTLSGTDSSGQTATSPKSISINANCEMTQAIQPILPVTGLVTLLTLTFTVTGDRATVLKNRRWLPRLAN